MSRSAELEAIFVSRRRDARGNLSQSTLGWLAARHGVAVERLPVPAQRELDARIRKHAAAELARGVRVR